MATYTSIINPGLVNAEGEHKYLNRLFTPGVSTGKSTTSLAVSQRGAGANMSVDIAVGDANFELPTGLYSIWGWTDAVTNLTITAADATNPRVDVIVAWVDTTVTTTGSANNPGSLKFSAIAGTPVASPVAVSDSAVQTALGASIAWVKLAYVYVGAGVSSITTGVITDARVIVSSRFVLSSSNSYNPYKFSVYLSTDQSATPNTMTKVSVNTKQYDTGNNFDTTNSRFIAPVSGFYQINAQVTLTNGGAASGSTMQGTLQKNGTIIIASTVFRGTGDSTHIPRPTLSGIIQMSAGDYIELFGYIGDTGRVFQSGASFTFINGFLVSTT